MQLSQLFRFNVSEKAKTNKQMFILGIAVMCRTGVLNLRQHGSDLNGHESESFD